MVVTTLANAESLPAIRQQYYHAINNSTDADRFYDLLKDSPRNNQILMAYFGCAQAIKARYSWNPYNKLSYLNKGTATLDKAVRNSPDNLEIRFLRFTLQYYIPQFLGYSKDLETDKQKIVELIEKKHFGSMDNKLLNNLIKFMQSNGKCSPKELNILNQAAING